MAQSQNLNQKNQQPHAVRSPEPNRQSSGKNLSGNNNVRTTDKNQRGPAQQTKGQTQPNSQARQVPNAPHQNKNKY